MTVAATTVKRVQVWSGLLRLSHWLMALAVTILLGTGWLLGPVPQFHDALLDYHYLAGYALIAGLLVRFYLLFFGRNADTLGELIPRRQQFPAMLDMLRFYLSFGRWRLPAWYAHNPLWQPIYLGLLALLLLQILSGVFADAPYLFAQKTLREWHGPGALVIAGISGLHVVAVFLHDLRGTGSDTSAMISGYRIFVIRPVQEQIDTGVQNVPLERIGRPGRKPGER
jgi:Ni/Fe-hydrogenase 1 B-type cytochrome subunit